MREYEIDLTPQSSDAQEQTQGKKDACRNYQEGRSDSYIAEHLANGTPLISQNNAERRATMAHAGHHKNKQEPLKKKSQHIKAHAVRIRGRAQMICKNLSIERPSA